MRCEELTCRSLSCGAWRGDSADTCDSYGCALVTDWEVYGGNLDSLPRTLKRTPTRSPRHTLHRTPLQGPGKARAPPRRQRSDPGFTARPPRIPRYGKTCVGFIFFCMFYQLLCVQHSCTYTQSWDSVLPSIVVRRLEP